METGTLREYKLPSIVREYLKKAGSKNIKGYALGECKIILSKDNGYWHFSISHPYRYPTSEEIDIVHKALLPGKSIKRESISENYCIQFFEIHDKGAAAN